ncbi:nicotinamide riboside transporter PnuC [Luteipulveratus sp. YIM 133132]|uniref:Nicotinamide riboside transporter PnuC n=1 Tax=Luteipulveratus flavus TaxID=3031728 RepID=A0ABT6C755_9MICO|nr:MULTISPECIES: nicotinamide riboside transporter PnuC [unclassified Luteipulveratus]MDE9364977.1 nicotinamide riboside transporter PnuC [Luteipulveratus sp. YIM 133132]MDF8264683.1 nicotinamide riboside transporter PnuC [Luteipulveratus sp. YIM 133296]
MSWTEVAGFVSGAVCVWLVVRRNIWNFPVGIANNVLFVVLFVGAGLYGDAALQVVYLLLGALGWYWWLRGGPRHEPLAVRPTPAWGWPAAVALTAAGTAVIWILLTRHTDSDVAIWDALTTSLSLVAQLMLNRKWVGSWVLWIVADLIYVPLYLHKDLALTAVLYLGFLGLATLGLVQWRRVAADATSPHEPVPVGAQA